MLNERLSPTPPPTPPTVPTNLNAGSFGFVLGIVIVVLWYLLDPGNSFRDIDPEHDASGFVQLTAAPLVLLAIALIAGWMTRETSFRAIFPIGTLAIAPSMFVRALVALKHHFISNGCDPDAGIFKWLESFFLSALAALALVFCSTCGFLLARYLVRHSPQWFEPALHTASWCVFGGMVCLLFAVAPRVLHRPSPERYVESLPILANVPLDASTEPKRVETGANWKLEIHDTSVADLVVRSVCVIDDKKPLRCLIELCEFMREEPWHDKGVAPYPMRLGLEPSPWEYSATCGPDAEFTVKPSSLVIREDRARGLVFVDAQTPANAPIRRAAKRSSWLVIDDVTFRDIADSTSLPRGWFGTALVGCALSGWFLLRRRRVSRRHVELVAAHAGVLGEDGWIELEGQVQPLRIDRERDIVPGPVLVLPRARTKVLQGPYRDETQSDHGEIVCGERDNLVARAEEDKLTWSARAAAILALTGMPLLAAIEIWFFGR